MIFCVQLLTYSITFHTFHQFPHFLSTCTIFINVNTFQLFQEHRGKLENQLVKKNFVYQEIFTEQNP